MVKYEIRLYWNLLHEDEELDRGLLRNDELDMCINKSWNLYYQQQRIVRHSLSLLCIKAWLWGYRRSKSYSLRKRRYPFNAMLWKKHFYFLIHFSKKKGLIRRKRSTFPVNTWYSITITSRIVNNIMNNNKLIIWYDSSIAYLFEIHY